jgi:hypothetical protein
MIPPKKLVSRFWKVLFSGGGKGKKAGGIKQMICIAITGFSETIGLLTFPRSDDF